MLFYAFLIGVRKCINLFRAGKLHLGINFLCRELTPQSFLLFILHLDSASLVMSQAEEMQALINFCGLPYIFFSP